MVVLCFVAASGYNYDTGREPLQPPAWSMMSLSPVDIGAIIATPVLRSTMAAVYVCLIPYTIARTSTKLFRAVRHVIRAFR